jgi:hypothetical protein
MGSTLFWCWAGQRRGLGSGEDQVLKMMKYEGFGFMYKTSIKGKQLHFVGYSFVDDTDIIQSGQPGEPLQVLATCM